MSDIKLDPKKLLGFRIIDAGGSTMVLHSPKIGAKGCVPNIAADLTADSRGEVQYERS